MVNSERIQAWFMGLPLPIRGGILVVIGIPLIAMIFFDVSPEEIIDLLPFFGILAVVAGVGGFFGWRYLEKKKDEQQAEANAGLARQGSITLVLPPWTDKTPSWRSVATSAENFAAYLAAAVRQFPDAHVALEIVGDANGTVLQIWAPREMKPTILQGLMSSFQDAQLREPQDILKTKDPLGSLDPQTLWITLSLAQKPAFPLKQTGDFATESLGFILSSLTREPSMGKMGLQLVLKAPDGKWSAAAQRQVQTLRQSLAQQRAGARASMDKARLAALEAKADALTGMQVTIRVFAEPQSQGRLSQLLMAVINTSRSPYNALQKADQGQGAEPVVGRYFERALGKKVVLSAEELAPIWHSPGDGGSGDLLTGRGVNIPPPAQVVAIEKPPFHPDFRIVGQGTMKDGSRVFVRWPRGADDFDSNVHAAIVGATGSGKSTEILNVVMQDLCSGRTGTVLLEPHRNLTLEIIASIPPEREGDVKWVNPTGRTRTFGLNPLDYGGDPRLRSAVGASFTAALEKIIGGDWKAAVRMRMILEATVEAVMEGIEQPTMLHLMAFLRREEYRDDVLARVTNPETKAFWEEEFRETGGSKRQDMLSPLFTRLRPLLVKKMTRQVVGQARTTLPIKGMMDAGEVVLIDVSANNPEVGEANASALGTLLVNAVWGAAGSRVKGHYPIATGLWIDEFHRFVTRDVEKMMAEARGFGLGVYVATQFWGQLPDWMQEAIMNNAWTKMVGRVNGPKEARLITSMFQGIGIEEILSLEAYNYVTQVCANKTPTLPFTLKTFPPLPPEKVHQAFRLRNGGRMPLPKDNGAIPYDYFAGVTGMDAGEQAQWDKHQAAMQGMDTEARAQYLVDLGEEGLREYKHLQRQQDLRDYRHLIEHPEVVPEVDLGDDERESLSEEAIKRVCRVRALSALQVETPRDIVLAEDLGLRREMDAVASVFDDLLL